MLCKIGILSKSELAKLEKGLLEILSLDKQGKFLLKIGDEDMHTKIENFLTEKYGEVGQKIHTGRSRNDQVLTAIRLYSKEMMENIKQDLAGLIKSFENFSKKYGSIKMPGYTHMQKAMPSSIRLWAGSFMDSLKDDSLMLNTAIKLNNHLYCQNSKGKIEAVILAALTQILLTINKFASDIMLFTTSEFNFFQA